MAKNKILAFGVSIALVLISIATMFLPTGYSKPTDSKMPVFDIQIPYNEQLIDKEKKEAYLTYYDENGETVFIEKPIIINQRGNSSLWYFPKKSYKIDVLNGFSFIDENKEPENLWVLNSEFFDYTYLRNQTAYAFAKTLDNIEYTTDYKYAEVFLNGDYVGVYDLYEQVEISPSRLDLPQGSVMIELMPWHTQTFDFEVEGSFYNVKNDKYSKEDVERMESVITNIEETLKTGDEKLIQDVLDIDSCVDMYILQEFTKNRDVATGSFYTYVKGDDDKLYFGPPWDFDRSAGSDDEIHSLSPEYLRAKHHHGWYSDLMEMDWFKSLVKKRWNEKKDEFKAIVENSLVTAEYYTEEFTRDFEKWHVPENYKINEVYYLGDDTNETHIEYYANWYNERFTWLDNYFNNVM